MGVDTFAAPTIIARFDPVTFLYISTTTSGLFPDTVVVVNVVFVLGKAAIPKEFFTKILNPYSKIQLSSCDNYRKDVQTIIYILVLLKLCNDISFNPILKSPTGTH